MLLALLLSALPLLAAGDPPEDAEPARQFDFWIGEWDVQNRHLQPDGSWSDGTRTRARITPVCGGNGILEEWAGPFRGGFMNGFSLRSWNPDRGHWDLVLLWTTDGNGAFGRLTGRFRHGRGEFFTPSAPPDLTRYTFSDALPTSVRWDSATSADGGVTWKTSWIMEFSRTRAAREVTQELLFAEDWNAGSVAPSSEARVLDWMLGSWGGTRTDAEGTEEEARLRCRLINKDCIVLGLLQTRADAAQPWAERLTVRGYVPRRRAWEGWRLSSADGRLRQGLGGPEDAAFVSTWRDPATGAELQEALIRADDDVLVIEESTRAAPADDWTWTRTTELARR